MAVALACLVGKEESSVGGSDGDAERKRHVFVVDDAILGDIMEVINASLQGRMVHGTFWTLWKLLVGLSAISVPDGAKEKVLQAGGVDVLAAVLLSKQGDERAML